MRVERRSLIKLTILGSAGLFACQLPDLRPTEQYTAPQLQQLGQEVANWTLYNGSKMVDLFPEARKASDILTGKINPRVFNPFINPPIKFSTDVKDADFVFHVRSDLNDSRGAGVISPSGRRVPYRWISQDASGATIRISLEILQTTARLPIIIKEVSSLYDEEDFCRLYLSLVDKAGGQTVLINPSNIPTTEQERVIALAVAASKLEEQVNTTSLLLSLIDIGGHIRTGGIMFANWYLDLLNRRQPVPQAEWFNVGHQYVGFLQRKRLIKQEGNMFIWTKGQPPAISSPEFLGLYTELTGRKLPVFPSV